jgi:osmotically-inducible protein OsmY
MLLHKKSQATRIEITNRRFIMTLSLTKRITGFFLALMMVSLVGCASGPNKEGTGEYVDDAVITTKVKAAIVNEPNLKSTEINVETYKGVVQLSGFVSSATGASRATELARGVKGVTSVKNDLRLK